MAVSGTTARALATAIALIPLPLVAAPTFFVETNSHPSVDATRDVAWQNAVGGFDEFDLDAFGAFELVDTIAATATDINIGLFDPVAGSASGAEIFFGNYAAGGGSYGTVSGGALLNRNGPNFEQIVFEFSNPVTGFGVWVFDDGGGDSGYDLIVTERGGAVSVSTPLLYGGNGGAFFVEGFLAVTSSVGLESVAVRKSDPADPFFELDHLQVATSVVPLPLPFALFAAALAACLPFRSRKTR